MFKVMFDPAGCNMLPGAETGTWGAAFKFSACYFEWLVRAPEGPRTYVGSRLNSQDPRAAFQTGWMGDWRLDERNHCEEFSDLSLLPLSLLSLAPSQLKAWISLLLFLFSVSPASLDCFVGEITFTRLSLNSTFFLFHFSLCLSSVSLFHPSYTSP